LHVKFPYSRIGRTKALYRTGSVLVVKYSKDSLIHVLYQ